MNVVRDAIVWGVESSRAEGQYVYVGGVYGFTVAADDRDGEPVATVARVLGRDRADIRALDDAHKRLRAWRKRWTRRRP